MGKTDTENPTNGPVLRGGCHCGNLTYTSTALPSMLDICHCTTCRRISGAPFMTWATFPVSALTFTSRNPSGTSIGDRNDKSALKMYTAKPWAERGHCTRCGSTVSFRFKLEGEEDSIYISAGSISEDSIKGDLPKPAMHIFVGEKAGWWDLPEDGIERHETFPEGAGYAEMIKSFMEEYESTEAKKRREAEEKRRQMREAE